MATEYKFMFDRRFDEEEAFASAPEDMSVKSVDGIPSISQLLDTLNKQLPSAEKEEEEASPSVKEGETTQVPSAAEEKELPDATEDATRKETPVSGQDENVEPERETDDFSGQERENAPESEAVAEELSGQDVSPTIDPPPPLAQETSAPAFGLSPSALPAFTEDQMKEAEEKAREEGRLSGLEEGREAAWQEAMVSLEKQNADTLLSIDASLKNVLNELEKNAQESFSTAVEFAMAVCRKAVPALCEANAVQEIRSLLEKNLHFLKDEPKISLRLTPFLADRIKPVLTDLVKREGYGGKIAVVRDDTLSAGDCRVEWKNGGLEKNIQDVLNHTEELVTLYTHPAPAGKPEADQTGEEHHG